MLKNMIFLVAQHFLPHHGVSRLVGKIMATKQKWLKNTIINWFIRRYKINMKEAKIERAEDFACFNDFFTRELKDNARVIADASIIAPADGAISQLGSVNNGSILQCKGRSYSVAALLGGEAHAQNFEGGSFMTIYLSPRDYHRVHSPLSGKVKRTVFIPGKLFSVNKLTAENVDNLFARNERVVCFMDTDFGEVAVVLVGAMVVASISLPWMGVVAPSIKKNICSWHHNPAINLEKAQEIGRFMLGSTVIVMLPKSAPKWQHGLEEGSTTCVGQALV